MEITCILLFITVTVLLFTYHLLFKFLPDVVNEVLNQLKLQREKRIKLKQDENITNTSSNFSD